MRISRTDSPVRATSPVINPSRGPGPMPAPMYSAVAKAFTTIPVTNSAMRTAMFPTSGSQCSVASTAIAMTTTLLTVPSPGFWRNGIHRSRTTAPVSAVIAPKLNGTCRLTP
ncbi:hypothetical protein CH289_24990 [Rhodococcus sp. RS1C4]|nr:hypothetical protein CH289_24990 [Rhodococcus sp. RS1C4]OZC60670.1 hypothetical protein CH267_03665 [Rhodococcus sp. 06-621-2]OZC89700.1 hypothetical protein CH282_07110 [Rhodococcus sp. 06-418-1B]OZD05876.1 hypothetical protein CH280_29310 [Rhodococcus sp. 06-156-4C]OZD16995.1 hypothetical protein CH248_22280 [Rhodococcus sp. 06-156-4a]OZD26851.1 hypothetical protein CH253_03800 [Rhodococcus sp. 06-156-3C]OZD35547.1 hypothetical protein CH284_16850 [Rhodococcus sp. 06-156-3]OZD37022.1 hy